MRYALNRSAVALVLAALAACSASNNTGGTVTETDAGNTGRTDVVSGGNDSSAPPADTGARDAGSTPRDTGSTARDTGPTDPYNYGTCGRTVIQALCMCSQTNQACQQTALQRSTSCVQCMTDMQTACCPAEVQAVQDCIQTNMCADQNCVTTRCGTQVNTATTCVNQRLQMQAMGGGGACVDAYLGCLGDLPTMQAAVCGSF